MNDTDLFSIVEILGLTAIGESEDLGAIGLQQTINSVMNRVAANLAWMGGSDARAVCLQKDQYDCWWPESNNSDRSRILEIGKNIPLYGPYVQACQFANNALAGNLPDIINGGVSYYDSNRCSEPYWARGKIPCLQSGTRIFYNLNAVE